MKLNLFKQPNCPHCEMLDLPSNLKINVIDITDGYEGFIPPNVPVMQVAGLSFEGPDVINTILNVIADEDNKV